MQKKCPICLLPIKKPNKWVRYHVRYNPPLVILACSFCNGTEMRIRRGLPLSPAMAVRAQKLLNFHRNLLRWSTSSVRPS